MLLCVAGEYKFYFGSLKKRDIEAGRVQNSPGLLLFSEMTKIQNIQSTRY